MSYCQSSLSLSVNCFKYPNMAAPAFMSDYDFVSFAVFCWFSLFVDVEAGVCWWCEQEQLLYWMPWTGREQPSGKPLSLTDSTVRVDHNLSKIIKAKRTIDSAVFSPYTGMKAWTSSGLVIHQTVWPRPPVATLTWAPAIMLLHSLSSQTNCRLSSHWKVCSDCKFDPCLCLCLSLCISVSVSLSLLVLSVPICVCSIARTGCYATILEY